MLFVDDGQAQTAKLDALLYQRVRAHHARDLAGSQSGPPRLALTRT